LKKKNRLKFKKKLAGSVRFRFYKQKTVKKRAKPEKPSQTRKTEPNRFEPVFALKKSNRTEPKPVGLTRFRFFF
jgi:hypothetical protein